MEPEGEVGGGRLENGKSSGGIRVEEVGRPDKYSVNLITPRQTSMGLLTSGDASRILPELYH